MSLKITLLGTGSSVGVPRIGPVWGSCNPKEPRNRRRRCALLVDQKGKGGTTTILVDTPADIREQMLDADVSRLDAVLYTHDHADHTHGIDDLRAVFFQMKSRIPIYANRDTKETLERRFDYCFQQPAGSAYPAILKAHEIEAGKTFTLSGPGGHLAFTPILQEHGDISSFGFRFGNVAYSPDVGGLPETSLPLLEGLDLWIVDALRPTPHPSHFSVNQTLQWIERLKVKRAILTHMTIELDYDTLRKQLPAHVEPGYDGMVIEMP